MSAEVQLVALIQRAYNRGARDALSAASQGLRDIDETYAASCIDFALAGLMVNEVAAAADPVDEPDVGGDDR